MAIIAPSVPNVMPLPENPVIANCPGDVSPMYGSPSRVSMTWPDHWWVTSASGNSVRRACSTRWKCARVSSAWPVL
jgi:hypothetical protein